MSSAANLGDAFEFVRNGKSIKQDKRRHGLPITRIETISNWDIDGSRVGYASLAEEGNEQWLLRKGDLLFSHINSVEHIGKCALFEGEPRKLIHGMNLLALRPKSAILDPRYAFRTLSSPTFRAKLQPFVNKAVNQASISATNLKSLDFPLPPLDQQRRIAAILDKADALRRKRKRALDLLDSLTKSIFLEMFGDPVANPRGWPVSVLGEVCDVRDGTHASPTYVEAGHPLLTSKNFSDGRLDYAGAKMISGADFAEINKRSKVDEGDIVMPMIGTIGSPVLMTCEPDFAIKNVALFKFKGSSPLPEYVLHLLDGPLLKSAINRAGRGGTQKFLSLGDLRGLAIPVPPLDIQERFKEFRQACLAQEDRSIRAFRTADLLFSCLQASAFSRQL